MNEVSFTVTQVRSAATCPRILYFDMDYSRRQGLAQPVVTRIWKCGDETTACGSLFHKAVEKFNSQSAQDSEIHLALTTAPDTETLAGAFVRRFYQTCVPHEQLFTKTGDQQQAFMAALNRYLREMADICMYARRMHKPGPELIDELFGDSRRRVNVAFPVGPAGETVRVRGVLDYVFHDWRTARLRILDYKLTPAHEPSNDLFQVCVYGLMHHVQSGTEPDVGVLYLHPARQMIEKPWSRLVAEQRTVFDLFASMHMWVEFDEKTGRGVHPPGNPALCNNCRWRDECEGRLGPKDKGERQRAPANLTLEQLRDRQTTNGGIAQESAAPGPIESTPQRDFLWLGETAPDHHPVHLPIACLPTHVAVVGAAGSGKTYLAKVIAEEAIRAGIPVLAIDPQGDLVQFLRLRDRAALKEAARAAYDEYGDTVEPRVYTPGSSHGIRLCLSPMRLARPRDVHGASDLVRAREEWEGLLEIVAANLVALAHAGGETDSQQTFLFQLLQRLQQREAGDQPLTLADLTEAVREPERVGVDDPDAFLRKTERERLARKLNNLIHGPAARLFEGGQPLDLDALCRPTDAQRVPLNVVYLNALTDDEQKQFFVAALAAEIYRWMITTGNTTGRPRLLFYLDEARDYLPAGARKPPAKDPLLRLFAQGRKYGVGCLLCTQSPRSVDYQVFGNCSTKFIGRLEAAQDVDRVADWFSTGSPPAWLSQRKGAGSGTFVGRWPEMPRDLEGVVFGSRELFSVHEGAWSPERLERERQARLS